MRIYVACLAAYNNGYLHGAWVEASSDKGAMQEAISAMLKASPMADAEEWAIHDYEDLPSIIGEFSSLDTVAAFVELVEDFEYIAASDLCDIVAYFGDVEDFRNNLDDGFCGIYESFRDYADEQAEEMLAAHGIGDENPLYRYFDYESYARDLEHSMTAVDVPSGVAIFYA